MSNKDTKRVPTVQVLDTNKPDIHHPETNRVRVLTHAIRLELLKEFGHGK
jgi:hypothetical protein